ncbi:hypothetical protein [Fodinibius salinus]|nr:hypothetical protein [Fodinibius salinus]
MEKENVAKDKRRKSRDDNALNAIRQAKQEERTENKNYGKRKQKKQKKKKPSNGLSLPTFKPWKVIVGTLVLGMLGMLYLNHVFATQQLLQEVQQLEREYNQVKRMHDNYRLTYDRMIGPSEIYDNAKQAGFINGGPAEKIITVEK